ncbi:hypothetical protein C8J56DRAFT_927188 [Mycena floridula]|nr:hypothetical protein C8J56DRAFT_927188 [Mycena floridula]
MKSCPCYLLNRFAMSSVLPPLILSASLVPEISDVNQSMPVGSTNRWDAPSTSTIAIAAFTLSCAAFLISLLLLFGWYQQSRSRRQTAILHQQLGRRNPQLKQWYSSSFTSSGEPPLSPLVPQAFFSGKGDSTKGMFSRPPPSNVPVSPTSVFAPPDWDSRDSQSPIASSSYIDVEFRGENDHPQTMLRQWADLPPTPNSGRKSRVESDMIFV